ISGTGPIYTITYAGVPSGFSILIGGGITATVATQGSNVGTVVSATINSGGNAVLVVNSVNTFTTAAMNVNYINRNITTPDPAQTEIVAMTLWT
ncbi:hypothetical protein, partial [Streptococcus pneumoniae]|uniref:hypothetical protein n=1 Tax=Streptococcus pneumoniae TaxID=1313 RepID=UPI0018B08CA8